MVDRIRKLLVIGEKQSLSATRNLDFLLFNDYNTLSATRKVLFRRFSIVEKINAWKGVPRRGSTKYSIFIKTKD
jgi:hypothetical protein